MLHRTIVLQPHNVCRYMYVHMDVCAYECACMWMCAHVDVRACGYARILRTQVHVSISLSVSLSACLFLQMLTKNEIVK